MKLAKYVICALAALFLAGAPVDLSKAVAQGFTLPNNTVVQGHLNAAPIPGAVGLPVGTTCTIVAGSSDSLGSCTTTSTAAVVTFGTAFVGVPRCIVTDSTANAATTAYTISATAITFSVVINAHLLTWFCVGQVGG